MKIMHPELINLPNVPEDHLIKDFGAILKIMVYRKGWQVKNLYEHYNEIKNQSSPHKTAF